MQKTMGFLIVFFFAQLQLTIVANATDGHDAHLNAAYGPQLTCAVCHGTETPPSLSDGQNLASTTVCDTCHSPGGTYDGVNSSGDFVGVEDHSVGAKDNWPDGVYDGVAMAKANWHTGVYFGKEIVRNYQRHYRPFNSEGG